MKKKIITSILASILLSSSFVPIFADVITDPKQVEIAEQRAKESAERIDLNIFINGQRLTFTKEENLGMPFVDKNNRTMVPVRKPIEMSGNSVVWDNQIKTAIITTKEKEIKVKLGDTLLLSKDLASGRIDKITMDTKAVTKNDRIYIPLRAIFESMGLKVEYNKDTKTVQAINYQDAKVWNKADIDKDFPDLNKSLNRYTLYDGTVGYDDDFNIENIKLDYSLKDKLRLGENNGEKWIEVHNKEKNQLLAFIKDGKVVYRSHIGTDSSYGRNHGYWSMDYEQDKDGYDIAKVDYILLYRYDNPFAILVENPFKRGDM